MWKQSWQCKGYSHIYTHQQQVVKYWKPNSSLHILTTSWNYVSLTTQHKKTLSHEWDKQTPSKKKKKKSSPCLHHQTRLIWPTTNAIQASMSAFHPHTHNDVIYLWLSTRKLAANGVSESPQIWRTHRRTAMLHMPLGNRLLCLNGKNMLSSCW